ncbi:MULTISPECIES: hypothetical protein [Enterococcus]|uniref:hypothetical protein n=1 Tax=Enterococcus TaxID=1350 RepID=UPI000CF01DEB|nr:hypothetical protein [Enterococcus faecium]EGP4917553.1 hypothetical protein [Enterococcus faecium]EGP5338432.1 hypothetical protein [Enterococcus faecium]EGP5559478.1 hypothetical protein [Enterococcus faecium]EGP5747415.1 hypothetical protein [Enterococcus faecium]EME3506553.1 hypothetical protein [Enterococcus faecium]
MKKYTELSVKETQNITGGMRSSLPIVATRIGNAVQPFKAGWNFGAWTADRVFGNLMGKKKIR